MGIYNKVCIGHVETVNLENTSPVEKKVVALKYIGMDKSSSLPIYKPLRKYKEYYKLVDVERLPGFVNDTMINNAIKKTGKKEVKILRKVA